MIFLIPLFLILILFCSPPQNKLILIKGGIFTRGKDITNRPDESPKHKVYVNDFYYHETIVSRKEFRKFVSESGYKTDAEKKGYCMISYEGMKDWEWEEKKDANYLFPFGKDSKIEVSEDTPVVCVSHNDAKSYCEFYGLRLPTEAEWEYAARAGSQTKFPWGENEIFEGKFRLNFWQGETHKNANSKDGHKYLSPNRAYPPNQWGVYDPVGNVWQFTNDFYSPLTYLEAYEFEQKNGKPIENPTGPKTGTTKVSRGGSWWCSEKTCNGYGLNYRGKIKPDSPFNNNGFRCAK